MSKNVAITNDEQSLVLTLDKNQKFGLTNKGAGPNVQVAYCRQTIDGVTVQVNAWRAPKDGE